MSNGEVTDRRARGVGVGPPSVLAKLRKVFKRSSKSSIVDSETKMQHARFVEVLDVERPSASCARHEDWSPMMVKIPAFLCRSKSSHVLLKAE